MIVAVLRDNAGYVPYPIYIPLADQISALLASFARLQAMLSKSFGRNLQVVFAPLPCAFPSPIRATGVGDQLNPLAGQSLL